jgi:copper chaperone
MMERTVEQIDIQGMGCDHCVEAVRRALEDLAGVDVEDVRIGTARVRLYGTRTGRAEVEAAIRDAGYSVATQGG